MVVQYSWYLLQSCGHSIFAQLITIAYSLFLLGEGLVHPAQGMLCLPCLHHQLSLGAVGISSSNVQLLTASSWTSLSPWDLISYDLSLPPHE